MDTRSRAFLAIRGGLLCAALGSLIGGSASLLIAAVRGRFGLAGLSLIPMAVLYAAITVAPFGFLVGAIGTWWLAARAQPVSGRRLYFEATGIDAVLGALFPLILTIAGWGPFENLVSAIPISIGTGVVCGLLLTQEVQKYAR